MSKITEKITANMILTKQNKEFPQRDFFLVPGELAFEAIIGYDILKGLNIQLYKNSLNAKINNMQIMPMLPEIVTLQQAKNNKNKLTSECDNLLSPYEHKSIKINLPRNFQPDSTLRPTLNARVVGLLTEDSVNRSTKLLKIINKTHKVLVIEKDTAIAEMEPDSKLIVKVNTLLKIQDAKREDIEAHEKETQIWKQNRRKWIKEINIGDLQKAIQEVPPGIQKAFLGTLRKFNEIFARTDTDIGLSQKYIVDLRFR